VFGFRQFAGPVAGRRFCGKISIAGGVLFVLEGRFLYIRRLRMAVKIRLTRLGRKKIPAYRIIVSDTRKPRDGKYIESIGTFRPDDSGKPIVLDVARFEQWVARGAQVSSSVQMIVSKYRRTHENTEGGGTQ
jgi:small subunit ribosomal protein S16